ncbi:hypothetical protein VPNG_02524 [Cytospora leucostoma]|uniref:J domain-containing protein n=1 Tax=Cytospora leucostoma TaxID=1230097 RepID=A0A423XI70_9PEZI|nr:hypothetical protein VPNG_02524 [Cytospora leucostoma]
MDFPLPPDPYKALGVDTTADAAAIKTAYRKLVLRCHPDKFPDPTIKAQKQEEFHGVQQAYEILGNEDKKRQYDLEVHAKKLREELQKKGAEPSSTNGNSRYYNVNVRTAEPPPGWSPSSRPPPQKSNSHKPYSGLFSQSWEHGIPSRSKAYHDEGRTARRAASYEKPKRPSKKPAKKHGDSPTRDKPSLKQRDRSGPRDESPTDDKGQSAHEKFQSALAYAAQYVQETKNKAGKPAPKVAPDVPSYSAAYPDPNEKFAPPAAKRRGSGDAKYAKGEPITVDASGPSKERPEMTNPDHFDAGRLSGEKHRQSRRRASFDEEDYFEHSPQPRVRKYSVNRDKGAAPRTVESRYKEPYGPSSGAPFPKVKMAPAYGPEHVATAKRYADPELSEYQAPSYSEYHSTQTAY